MSDLWNLRGTGVLSILGQPCAEVGYRLNDLTQDESTRGILIAPAAVLSTAFLASNAGLRLADGHELAIELTNFNSSGTAQIRTVRPN